MQAAMELHELVQAGSQKTPLNILNKNRISGLSNRN